MQHLRNWLTCHSGATCLPKLALKIQLSVLIFFNACIIISSNVTCFCHDVAEILLISLFIKLLPYSKPMCLWYLYKLFFGDSLTSNILFEVTLGKLSYIYDRPFLYNTVKHIDQWDNNSWCVLGFNT